MSSPALDLGWCKLRPLSHDQARRVRHAAPSRRHRVMLAAFAGIHTTTFNHLPSEKKLELHLAAMWMTYPFGQPRIGKVIVE